MKNQKNHNEHHEKYHEGFCICPECEEKIPHQNGLACKEEKCPNCGTKMMREFSYTFIKIKRFRKKDRIKSILKNRFHKNIDKQKR